MSFINRKKSLPPSSIKFIYNKCVKKIILDSKNKLSPVSCGRWVEWRECFKLFAFIASLGEAEWDDSEIYSLYIIILEQIYYRHLGVLETHFLTQVDAFVNEILRQRNSVSFMESDDGWNELVSKKSQ